MLLVLLLGAGWLASIGTSRVRCGADAGVEHAHGRQGFSRDILPGLTAGTTVGALAFATASPLTCSATDNQGTMNVSGTARPRATHSDLGVVAVRGPDGERWCVIPTNDVSVVALASSTPPHRALR